VGAENPVTATDQHFHGQPMPRLQPAGPGSMIARCGPTTQLPNARPSAELAGAARPILRNQGHRDPRAPSRARRAPPT
jgi:hypothetical protein